MSTKVQSRNVGLFLNRFGGCHSPIKLTKTKEVPVGGAVELCYIQSGSVWCTCKYKYDSLEVVLY